MSKNVKKNRRKSGGRVKVSVTERIRGRKGGRMEE